MLLLLRTNGGVAYTLTAAPGSYAQTGTAAGLYAGRTLTAAGGSYTTTGTAAALTAQRKLTATPGAYALTGTPAALAFGYKLTLTPGSFTLTGTAATFVYNRRLTASVGHYTLTGTSVTLTSTALVLTTVGGTRTAQIIPVDAKRQDWPRLAANRVNAHEQAIISVTPYSRVVDANTSVQSGESLLLCNAQGGNITVTLPDLSARVLMFKKVDSSANTVTVQGVATIDGAASYVLSAQYDSLRVAGGAEWHLV